MNIWNQWIDQNPALFAIGFAVVFVLMWLGVTLLLPALSGWSRLTEKFPDRPEAPLLQLGLLSGTMNSLNMRGILTLSACPSGLRVSIMRLFAPTARDFFVPWEAISVTREDAMFGQTAILKFGQPSIGTLTFAGRSADKLARAAAGRWPEAGAPQEAS
jgi:hypothetical protein